MPLEETKAAEASVAEAPGRAPPTPSVSVETPAADFGEPANPISPEAPVETLPPAGSESKAQEALGDCAPCAVLPLAVRSPQVAPTLERSPSSAILGAPPLSQLADEAVSLEGLTAVRPHSGPHPAELSTSAASDALARANQTASGLLPDFAGDLAQAVETSEARVPRANHTPAANASAAEILRQVRVGLSADLREANIQLAPEALGSVSIRLRVEHGVLSADVRAESAQALRALELHAPELKAALAQHGLEPRTLAFSFMNSHGGDAPSRGHASQSRSQRASFTTVDLAPVSLERALARRLSASGVDTYA